MNNNKQIKKIFFTILIAGILTLPLTLISPSESSAAYLFGVSRGRVVLFGIQLFSILALVVLFLTISRKEFQTPFGLAISRVINKPTHYQIIRNVLFGFSLFASFAFVYFSVFIPQALSAFSAWLAFSAWVVYAQFVRLVPSPADYQTTRFLALFPSWKGLSSIQKKTSLVLLFLGLVYFCLFIPLNLRDSSSLNELELDEMVTYPVIVKMLSSQPNLQLFLYQFFNYGAYIYGFPFFGSSAAILLPVKLIFGQGFSDHLQLNMVLLRQLINVLPAVLACFLFTYLATHFKRFWASILLFLILLTLPGVVHVNNTFWHPDMLNLFFIALTLFYLDRDQLRFGANFYFGVIAIGLSVATRLFGLFFFLAVAYLLIAGLIKKRMTIRKTFLTGTLAVALLAGTILVSNPYLFSPGEPAAALKTFTRQGETLAHGVDEADPENIYRTGLDAWWPFMTQYYGSSAVLFLLGISATIGCFGPHRSHFYRILFAWLLVIGTYLIGFVAVKSSWYLLPFLIPLYCAALAIPENLAGLLEKYNIHSGLKKLITFSLFILFFGLGIWQFVENIQTIAPSMVFHF